MKKYSVAPFLKKNGFKWIYVRHYSNEKCEIHINKNNYTVLSEGCLIESEDLNIYWLIGYLTYYDLIDKNYKK